jgi:hypothetical protein
MKLYVFRTVPLPIIRSVSQYTQQWYMSYRFVDSFRTAGSGYSGMKLNMFRTVPLSIRSISLYTQPWYTLYRFVDETSRVSVQNKFEKLVDLVGFIIRICHDARLRVTMHGHVSRCTVTCHDARHMSRCTSHVTMHGHMSRCTVTCHDARSHVTMHVTCHDARHMSRCTSHVTMHGHMNVKFTNMFFKKKSASAACVSHPLLSATSLPFNIQLIILSITLCTRRFTQSHSISHT